MIPVSIRGDDQSPCFLRFAGFTGIISGSVPASCGIHQRGIDFPDRWFQICTVPISVINHSGRCDINSFFLFFPFLSACIITASDFITCPGVTIIAALYRKTFQSEQRKKRSNSIICRDVNNSILCQDRRPKVGDSPFSVFQTGMLQIFISKKIRYRFPHICL